jgi:hypothetical protein
LRFAVAPTGCSQFSVHLNLQINPCESAEAELSSAIGCI